ncbi:MAG TPA: ATP synthase F1 subunit delta [Kofleriaceae bacterium]|nr:ATP synthase F1 subunit delta [Kofleriaceae bacterium]
MITGSLARRYAKALFEIGLAQHNVEHLGTDVRAIAAAMKESAELASVLSSPAIRRSERRKVVDALIERIGVRPITKNFVELLLDHERFSALPGISRELDAMIEAKAGRVHAEVTSAKPLDPTQLTQITAALEKLSGKKVTIAKREDPELLGGVVAKVGDVVYDGSLRTQLAQLRDQLK